ncbi:MAG: hypothetical protein QF637_10095 [Acidimicrobiales bacterium]|nr:hypothetical protein [Acidimicrobiales bacterium]
MAGQRERLRKIQTFPSLVKYLRDELDWPVSSDDFGDLTFDYTSEELGLDARNAAKIEEIKRLRPLTANQPWGIFFVKFEPKSLPVVALRRILNSVVTKKRASSNASDLASWEMTNLMFISSYGEGSSRQISFAHFAEADENKKLPELRVLGWDSLDTPLHLDHVAGVLSERLVWPDDEDPDSWLEQWGSAFTSRHREVVATSQKLAIELARLARSIRDRIRTILEVETENGPVSKLLATFREAMLDDISTEEFADTYAQTIAYGLLSERITNPEHQTASLSETGVPFTNPFLKELLGAFFAVGTSNQRTNGSDQLNFDELGVYDIVELLASANMEAVVRDFGDQNPSEDPVVHFYELFLEEYDPGQRIELGVYYTPRPVVSYIVRSVDEILKRDFLLPLGVADPTTWTQLANRIDGFEIPEDIDPDRPYVSMLDPATGTGTFLVEWLTVAERNVKENAKRQGLSGRELDTAWVEALTQTVLPNMAAFEITMASYAVAHLKVSLSLPAELRSTETAAGDLKDFIAEVKVDLDKRQPKCGSDNL